MYELQSHPSSFRDPSGFLFYYDKTLYRQVNNAYSEDYKFLMDSGLYQELVDNNLLIPHSEVSLPSTNQNNIYKIIKPEPLSFVSYPYEWCFSQLKDAAQTTLRIQRLAMEKGMLLKDASAYNIQFHRGHLLLIDTLSLTRYNEGEPWIAYRQFCQHFLAPLLLMANVDLALGQLLRIHLDGIPLELTAKLLSLRSRFRFGTLFHIYLHANSQIKYANKGISKSRKQKSFFSKKAMMGLVASLESLVDSLKMKKQRTEWGEYYATTNYSDIAMKHKQELVAEFLNLSNPDKVWDLGANTGFFSRIATSLGKFTVAFDIDPIAVDINYSECQRTGDNVMLPLILDLTNPSPGLGWANCERNSFIERGPVDLIIALALIHHLAISNNLPLHKIALFFKRICRWLIIEFIPKSDSQVKRLLMTRKDIFDEYTKESFEREFKHHFRIVSSSKIKESERILYLMKDLK